MKNHKLFIVCIFVLLISCFPSKVYASDFVCHSKEIYLPYPGMISHQPMYVLKKIRDKILEQFILEPDKRMEYYLFESKKMFHEALMHQHALRYDHMGTAGLKSIHFLTLFVTLFSHVANDGRPIATDAACDYYSIIELQTRIYNEMLVDTQDNTNRKSLENMLMLLKQNKDGFDNLLVTMNSRRIIYE